MPQAAAAKITDSLQSQETPLHAVADPDPFFSRGILGRANAMTAVFGLVRKVSASDATVILTGETGTGKGIMARAIHDLSGRSAKPFVTINCGAIPEQLLESELFGHVRGAFTGATGNKTVNSRWPTAEPSFSTRSVT